MALLSRIDPKRGMRSRSARTELELLGNVLGLAKSSVEQSPISF